MQLENLLAMHHDSGISLGKLISLLNKLNQDVDIVVKRRVQSKNPNANMGHVNVNYI